MIQEIIANLCTLEVAVAMIVAILGGMLIGALPGLSATMGVALLIPLTYSMTPSAALIMLTVLYTSAIYGGSFTAILIHTPGTASSAATAMDGYQLTLKGQGLRALGIATVSSMFGGTVSAIMLMFIAPQLAKLSLMFGPPEYFLISLFGLTVIGSLASGNMLKGLMAGVLGLIISTCGTHIYTGYYRFTFNITLLQDGIRSVVAMIGLFSLSQVLIQVEDYIHATKKRFENSDLLLKGRRLPTWAEIKRLFPNMIRSSIIGVLVGILPGAGGDIGSWVSYNEAKRFSKNKEEFGKGSIEGICASEAANNAVTGGALIPLLTLGVPGSSTTAVVLGALLIHGLTPGHTLFATNGTIVYTMMTAFLVGNILMGLVGLLISKRIVRMCNIPTCILSPVIVVLATIGAYSIAMNIFDVCVMLFFGFLGYLMKKTKIPAAPLVLGMLLGETAELGYTQSITIAKGRPLFKVFIGRPICIVLMIMIILAIASPFIADYYTKRRAQKK